MINIFYKEWIMTLKELNIFYQLCEDSHISNLAKKLGLTQSAISLAVKSLEKKVDEQLFDRLGKKLVLNERGRFFRQKTEPHFMALNDAKNLFKNDKISGILNITSSKTIGDYITPQIIFDFLNSHLHVEIKKDIQNSKNIINLVKNYEIDMGFIESVCDDPDIIKKEIKKDRLVVVTSDKRLKDKTCYIDELLEKKWLLREKGSGTRDIFLNSIGYTAKELEVFMEFNEFEEAKTILFNNPQTITCLSKFVVEKELQREDLFEITLKNLNIERKLYLIYHKNKYKSKLFIEFENSLF